MLLGDQELLPSGILDSLNELDFLAVIGPHLPESLTDKAHAFIPKPLWLEENGTYTSLDGSEFDYKQRVLEPPEGIKDTWQTLLSLAKKSNFNPGFTTWDELRKKTATVMEANGDEGKNI